MKATYPVRSHVGSCVAAILTLLASLPAIAGDWPMFGGSASRNMVSSEKGGPVDWDVKTGRNIKWVAGLGSRTFGTPVVSEGKVFVGTNNEGQRDPANTVDGGVQLAFDEATGKFLWQKFYPKLPIGRNYDWPGDGLCAAAYSEPGRLWCCTNTCHVICFDMSPRATKLSDGSPPVIWDFDMIGKLGVSPRCWVTCSPVSYQDKLYVITGNGRLRHHPRIDSPDAPSVVCFDKHTGNVVWEDNSPGINVLAGQWSSPCIAEVGGRVLLIAALGDGWLYAYDAVTGKVIWKFDCNDKEVTYPDWRSELPATPVVVGDRLYIANGVEAEMAERNGRLWCIDITKSGDISAELDAPNIAPWTNHKGVPNPKSGVVWQVTTIRPKQSGKIEWADRVHSSLSTVAVSDGLVFLPDMSGYFRCFDARTGEHRWTRNLESAVRGSPLVVDGKVYVGDEDGVLHVFKCSPEMKVLGEHKMGAPIETTPVFANGVLYVATSDKLYAVGPRDLPGGNP